MVGQMLFVKKYTYKARASIKIILCRTDLKKVTENKNVHAGIGRNGKIGLLKVIHQGKI